MNKIIFSFVMIGAHCAFADVYYYIFGGGSNGDGYTYSYSPMSYYDLFSLSGCEGDPDTNDDFYWFPSDLPTVMEWSDLWGINYVPSNSAYTPSVAPDIDPLLGGGGSSGDGGHSPVDGGGGGGVSPQGDSGIGGGGDDVPFFSQMSNLLRSVGLGAVALSLAGVGAVSSMLVYRKLVDSSRRV